MKHYSEIGKSRHNRCAYNSPGQIGLLMNSAFYAFPLGKWVPATRLGKTKRLWLVRLFPKAV